MSRESSTTGPTLVEVTNLTLKIDTPRGTVKPIEQVNVVVRRGETLGVVGETGSGKSMLIRSIMGLLPVGGYFDDESRVTFDGVDITRFSDAKLRRLWGKRIALVPQDPGTSLNPVRRIGDQMSDTLRHQGGMSRKEAYARSAELLDRVGIASAGSRLKLYPHELSGGMRQRILIAIAISLAPELLVADEPTTALDVTVQSQIMALIDDLKREMNMSVVLVSHDLSLVGGHSDRVAVMYGGKLVEEMPGNMLSRDSRHPYTAGLLRSHPDLIHSTSGDLATIAGEPPDILHRPPGCPFQPRCDHSSNACGGMPRTVAVDAGHFVACHHPRPPGESAGQHARVASEVSA
jgi:peptide/nickel transport system ATP-binding protein